MSWIIARFSCFWASAVICKTKNSMKDHLLLEDRCFELLCTKQPNQEPAGRPVREKDEEQGAR